MTGNDTLPRFSFRPALPSLLEMARRGVSDISSVIPEAILEQPCLQLPGPGAPLVVADPELVREVLNDRTGNYARDRFMRRLMRRTWGKGLAAAEGAEWQAQRRAAAPAFRPDAVQGNLSAFAAAAGKAVTNWTVGSPIDLQRHVARIIADIVFTTLVDERGEVDTAAVAADMPSYVRRVAAFGPLDMLPLPEFLHDRLAGIDSDPAVLRLRALAERLAAGRSKVPLKTDMIALLDGVGPLEDNIRGLFPAAMDTTVAGVSWTLYTLACHPAWQAQVAAEGQTCGGAGWAMASLPITRRVVQEALRLFPPAPLLVRAAAQRHELGGQLVRKGQPVVLSIYAMHRHRMLWDQPDAFDPDRFSGASGLPSAWLPFGAGPRVCIAAQFALAETAVVVARLLAELELSPIGPEPEITLQVTTRSKNGLNVIARKRDCSGGAGC